MLILHTSQRYQSNRLSESAFFYFIFDPAVVSDYFKTKLTNRELDEGGRCSHLKKFPKKFQIAECCMTDLPEGLRYFDHPKSPFSQNTRGAFLFRICPYSKTGLSQSALAKLGIKSILYLVLYSQIRNKNAPPCNLIHVGIAIINYFKFTMVRCRIIRSN